MVGLGGGQGRCEQRSSEDFVRIQKKKFFFFWGGGGSQGGCEQRIEVLVKIKKKWGGVGGVRVDVTEK